MTNSYSCTLFSAMMTSCVVTFMSFNKQLLGEVFVICGIIKVEVSVIMKSIACELYKHCCQKSVAMETSKLLKTCLP